MGAAPPKMPSSNGRELNEIELIDWAGLKPLKPLRVSAKAVITDRCHKQSTF